MYVLNYIDFIYLQYITYKVRVENGKMSNVNKLNKQQMCKIMFDVWDKAPQTP